MAGIERNLIEAVRAVLIGDATLIALVPAAQIVPKSSPYPAVYPAITLSPTGSRDGGYVGTWRGLFWIRIYHQGASAYGSLDAILGRVRALLDSDTSFASISDSDITVHRFNEVTYSEIIDEDESPIDETYSLNGYYRVIATDET